MALPKEAIETVLSFYPGSRSSNGRRVELGEVVEGVTLVHDVLPYQMRAQCIPGEPLVLKWTQQPVLALVAGERVTTLAYATDVKRLDEPLAVRVIDHLVALNDRRTRGR